MNKLKVVILAGGQGTRMKSKIPKVLHKILDRTMIDYVIEVSNKTKVDETIVIVGNQSAMVKSIVGSDVTYAFQKEQLGTGHAVIQALPYIHDGDDVLIMCGDTPLVKFETLNKLIDIHKREKSNATVISTNVNNPAGYGRIVRQNGIFNKIVEQKDTTEKEAEIREVNTGIYIFKAEALKSALNSVSNDNSQNEYYLTDTLEIIKNNGDKIGIMIAEDSEEFLGVNTKSQLATASSIMKRRINKYHMNNGVTIEDPNNTYIGRDVKIGEDTVILPNTIIEGNTVIGCDCVVGPNTRITSSEIRDCVTIMQSTILSSFVDNYSNIGPFAYLRPNSKIGEHVKIGDFVEVKNSNIDDHTKVSHLTYIGDSDVGKNVNFGCGTVTVNYDGVSKHRTVIEDNAFIGCNTNLIAPVKVEKNGTTAAGSTISKDVPKNSLGIARVREQVNKLDYKRDN